eukprot:6273785-Pyramimonas_sp.AAC.1
MKTKLRLLCFTFTLMVKKEPAEPQAIAREDFAQRLHKTRLRVKGEETTSARLGFGKHKGKSFESMWQWLQSDSVAWRVAHLNPSSGYSQAAWLEHLVGQ